jgi:hypothetical protein
MRNNSVTVREKHRLFENRVLRRIFGRKREEVTGDWRSCTMRSFIVRFQVLTAASIKMALFWVVAPCSLVVYRRFRGARPDDGGSKHL